MRVPWFALAFCAAACSALPSAVPLADIGVEVAPSSNDRGRRKIASADEGAAGEAGEVVAVTADVKPVKEAAADAGAPDSGSVPPSQTDTAQLPTWPGEYHGSDRFVRRFDSEPEDVQLDDKARTRVEQPTPAGLVISIVNSLTGDVICALKASVQGTDATLDSGQSCFAGDEIEAEVTSGRAKLTGDLLTLDFEGKVQVAGDEDEAGESGRDSYHFEGRRR